MEGVSPVTHGVTDHSVSVAEFRLTETSHAPHTRLGRHRHAYPAITFVLRGGFSEDFGREGELSCGAMSVLLKPAGAAHSNTYSKFGARSFILECVSPSPLFERLDRVGPRLASARHVRRMLELYTAFVDGAPERLVLAEEIALELSREAECGGAARTSARPRWLAAIADAVQSDCTIPLSLSALAAGARVHPVYLARAFRRQFGQSIGRCMLEARLRLAMHRLTMSSDPISQIAIDCGFNDQPHFTRMFGREVGQSPARFRRAAQASAPRDRRELRH
jgi:AraC family transcriptional regulator